MEELKNMASNGNSHNKQNRILRAKWMDYRSPSIMMVTIVTTKRLPLLGKLQGENIILTELGQKVAEEIKRIPTYNGAESIEIYSYVIMPDHVHILLHIHEHLPRHVGYYIRWFKKQCTYIGLALAVPSARNHSPLFAPDYHDRLLKGKNQLSHMVRYIQDNPRRLALKRANKDLFRIRQNQLIGTIQCTVLGNIFLIEHPLRQVLQCSRRLTQEQIDNLKADCLREAADGTIYVTAAISEGEKQIARALREAGFPLIILLEKGFPAPDDPHYSYFKPQGVYFEACAAGKLLLIEPHRNLLDREDIAIKTEAKVGHIPHDSQRYRFVAMNILAEDICK
jgi:REP element-mobilizing transposase RayT